MQSWLTFILPAAEKAAADAAFAQLTPAYATFASASATYQAKLTSCKNQPWTTNDVTTTCASADSMVTCSIKLAEKCVASEKTAMLNARAAVSAAALSLGSAAGALGVLTH